jgi:hypothetical protein
MNAYLVSHNGLGDNLFMIGAINYIKQFYTNVYFLCKNKYYDNVRSFFHETSNVICLPIDENNEYYDIINLVTDKYKDENNDILICGGHKNFLTSRITNKSFLNHKLIDKNYTIDFSSITTKNYSFIEKFYIDINLNLTYFYEYFDLPSTKESKTLFDSVSDYYLIFIQYKCSDGRNLNISNLIEKYINDNKVLLISNDVNFYDKDKDSKQHFFAQKFVYNKIVNYVDTIKNCDEIYIIDSCFIGLILPFLKTNRLKTEKVSIIFRDEIDKYIL